MSSQEEQTQSPFPAHELFIDAEALLSMTAKPTDADLTPELLREMRDAGFDVDPNGLFQEAMGEAQERYEVLQMSASLLRYIDSGRRGGLANLLHTEALTGLRSDLHRSEKLLSSIHPSGDWTSQLPAYDLWPSGYQAFEASDHPLTSGIKGWPMCSIDDVESAYKVLLVASRYLGGTVTQEIGQTFLQRDSRFLKRFTPTQPSSDATALDLRSVGNFVQAVESTAMQFVKHMRRRYPHRDLEDFDHLASSELQAKLSKDRDEFQTTPTPGIIPGGSVGVSEIPSLQLAD